MRRREETPEQHAPRLRTFACALTLVLAACQASNLPPAEEAPPGPVSEGPGAPAGHTPEPAPPDSGPAGQSAPPMVDGPPENVPYDLSTLPDPVPVTEPKSATGNPPSYSVYGKTYHTLDSVAGYEATGRASWYGRKFQGRRTSSGETFDTLQLSAAHPTLPIPSYVRVTNLENDRQMVVRVNDRGPFHDNRIIDLSYAAAVKLGFAEAGTAPVRVVALENLPELYLQAGAFRQAANADRLRVELEQLTSKPARVVRTDDNVFYRVRLGPLNGEREAQRLRALIATADHGVAELQYVEPPDETL